MPNLFTFVFIGIIIILYVAIKIVPSMLKKAPIWSDPQNKEALEPGREYCRLIIEGRVTGDKVGIFITYYSRDDCKQESPGHQSREMVNKLRQDLSRDGWEQVYHEKVTGDEAYYYRRYADQN